MSTGTTPSALAAEVAAKTEIGGLSLLPSSSSSPNNAASGGNNNNNNSNKGNEEDELRKSLRLALQSVNRREPLEPTYKRLLLNSNIITTKRPIIPKDKFYNRVRSNLRERVELYQTQQLGKDPFDRVASRQSFTDEKIMRAALTLRESKEHEQQALLDATMMTMYNNNNSNNRGGMDETTRKRHFDGIALTLQSKEKKKPRSKSPAPFFSGGANHNSAAATTGNTTTNNNNQHHQHHAQETEMAKQQAELERQRTVAKEREMARMKRREEEEERERRERQQQKQEQESNLIETPQQALHKYYQPLFKKLWDMEFPNLNHTNPFRIVIDRSNCAAMGAPDYCDVVKTPMNLTYIQQKVNNMEYETLQAFLADVDLMISNALLYNSDPNNPYRIAAEDMKKKYLKMAKKLLQTLQQKQSNK